ncbi:MAG TPA: hypothetical protein VI488_07210 [Candidatus Angelobacter sp.]
MNAGFASAQSVSPSRLGAAWIAHCLALALHVTDEALTGFLTVYNPTVLAIRPAGWWFPPVFAFGEWLTGLICLVVILLGLSPFFFRGVRWVRPIGYFFGVINILNAMGHITGTIFGQTVASVHFARPMPGFYSSPFLLAASIYLLMRLSATRRSGN